jgi:tetratricopeptide (TPR) repeat protein
MKKFMTLAMMAAVAMTASAQMDVVKNAKKLFDTGDVDATIQTVQPALSTGTPEEKAAAWNLLSQAQYKKFSDIQAKKLENQVKKTNEPVDEKTMNEACVAAFEAALKCDEFDAQPNEKGKVKMKYRTDNQKIYQNVRLQCINAGQYEYNQKNYKGAFKAFALYVDTKDAPLFTGIDMSKDEYRNELAYFASLAAYQSKDYSNVYKYATIALQDSAKVKDATEVIVFSKKDNMKTKADTLDYIESLKEASTRFPEDTRYSAWIGDYYLQSSNTAELSKWADAEIAKNPENKFAYTYKGEALRLTNNYDEAVAMYKKAAELDPTYVAALYQAGVTLNSKAISLKDKLADKNTGMLTVANANKVKEILTEAKGFLEKVRELDPNRDQVNWAYALYQMYYSLGDKAKTAELEKIVSGN